MREYQSLEVVVSPTLLSTSFACLVQKVTTFGMV